MLKLDMQSSQQGTRHVNIPASPPSSTCPPRFASFTRIRVVVYLVQDDINQPFTRNILCRSLPYHMQTQCSGESLVYVLHIPHCQAHLAGPQALLHTRAN